MIFKVITTFQGSLGSKFLTLIPNIPSEVPQLLIGDGHRIQHVIGNLVNNAIKFSPIHGSILVSVCVKKAWVESRGFSNQSFVSLCVSVGDEGPGISKENQMKLFTDFYQIQSNALQQGQGSGLGLFFCKKIVSLHGGEISVESKEGQGSIFSFLISFPVAPTSATRPLFHIVSHDVSRQSDNQVWIPQRPKLFRGLDSILQQ